MGVLIGSAMVLMVIVLGILFAYASHRFLPVLFVGIGLTTALGFMGLAGIQLNMAVLGAFPVMIGLGIDYGIQFHARLDEEARKGSLDEAVMVTVTRTGPAVMYAMLATCMGFIAMFISTVPMIRSFGLVAMIGVMSCFVISLIGIPTIAHLLKYTPKQQEPEVCYAVGEEACDYIPSQTQGHCRQIPKHHSTCLRRPWGRRSFFGGRRLTGRLYTKSFKFRETASFGQGMPGPIDAREGSRSIRPYGLDTGNPCR